ncbi:hypothetical protein MBANPS3_008705 [Mucor bainieri]
MLWSIVDSRNARWMLLLQNVDACTSRQSKATGWHMWHVYASKSHITTAQTHDYPKSSTNMVTSSGNAIMPAARYIFGAGNYMTIDPELYYPNACLFCGLPNGSKRETTATASLLATSTSQEIIVATAAPTMQFYNNAETNKKPHELEEIIVQHRHRTSKNLASIMSNQLHSLFQRWRRYLIQKRLHFPVVTQGRKRYLIPSSFY